MDARAAYRFIVELEKELQAQLMHEAEVELTVQEKYRSGPNYRTVQALAAAYTLQDYFAGAITESIGESPDEE